MPGLHVPGDGERRRLARSDAGARRRRPGDVEPRPRRGRHDAVTPRTKAVLAVHLFGRPLDWEALPDRGAAGGGAARGRRRRARRAVARDAVRRARSRGLPLASTRARSSRPERAARSRRATASSPPRCGGCATTGSTRARTCRARLQLPARRHPLRDRDPAAAPARRAAGGAERIAGGTPSGCATSSTCPTRTRATGTAGRRT